MAHRQCALGVLAGILISILTQGIFQLHSNSALYATTVYKTTIPDVRFQVEDSKPTARQNKSAKQTKQLEVEIVTESTSSTTTSTTESTSSTTTTTESSAASATINKALRKTTTLEALCRELKHSVQEPVPTYPPLPNITGLLPYHTENHIVDDNRIADMLYKKVRVLCWVMTSPEGLDKKAIHTYLTWGHRCNKILYISTKENATFPAPVIAVQTEEGREHLTAKTMLAFKHIYENHYEDADWFMKADDDTFVVLENLRYFLADRDPMSPVYYGHHYRANVEPQGYYSGGGGYVISKEALKRFGTKASQMPELCKQDHGAEDAQFGSCMQALGVHTAESFDEKGRSRFHAFQPGYIIAGVYPDWYHQYDSHNATKGRKSISEYPISFHYMTPDDMHNYEFYLYHLKVFGMGSISYPKLHEHYTSVAAGD